MRFKFEERPFLYIIFGRSVLECVLTIAAFGVIIFGLLYKLNLWPF